MIEGLVSIEFYFYNPKQIGSPLLEVIIETWKTSKKMPAEAYILQITGTVTSFHSCLSGTQSIDSRNVTSRLMGRISTFSEHSSRRRSHGDLHSDITMNVQPIKMTDCSLLNSLDSDSLGTVTPLSEAPVFGR